MVLKVRLVSGIDECSPQVWQALFGVEHPFTRYEYLLALETSGACSTLTGWQARHLEVTSGDETVALMPLYLKHHSYGEYVFDWAWAEAYQEHSIDYYPKLLSAIPFTPVTGQRLGYLASLTDVERQEIWFDIEAFLTQSLNALKCSSWHCLFMDENQRPIMARGEGLTRLGTQFHWFNRGYLSFDGFLSGLTARKRKLIVKERAAVAALGLTFEFISGQEVTEAQWLEFSQCYRHTYLKRSGHDGYLTSAFFLQIGASMGDSIRLLRVCDKQGQCVASALYFVSSTHLYGRYWGALVDIPGLHFEACYYQGIEYAIEQGLTCFDAGAQGEHKVARGFEPVAMHSFHEIKHSQFRVAIKDYCQQERRNMQIYMTQMAKSLPYKG